MKVIFAICLILVLQSCDSGVKKELEKKLDAVIKQRDELHIQLVQRNNYIKTITHLLEEINKKIFEISQEHLIILEEVETTEIDQPSTLYGIGGSILDKIDSINKKLITSHTKLDSLENILKSNPEYTSEYKISTEYLRNIVYKQQEQIRYLKIKIHEQSLEIEELKQTVETKDLTIEQKNIEIIESLRKINTRYIIIGTSDFLESNNIISYEGGIIGIFTTTIISPNIDVSYFDKLQVDSVKIEFYGKVDEIIPERSEYCYKTDTYNGKTILYILDKDKFWFDKKCVIVIDY